MLHNDDEVSGINIDINRYATYIDIATVASKAVVQSR